MLSGGSAQFWIGMGLLAGAAVAAQGPVNAELARHVDSAGKAAFVSFAVGAAVLGVTLLVLKPGSFDFGSARAAPWWAWTGGFYGAFLVTLSVLAIPRVGIAPWVGALIAGQLLTAMLYDHFGAFNQPIRTITWDRLLGAVLLLIGAWMVQNRRL